MNSRIKCKLKCTDFSEDLKKKFDIRKLQFLDIFFSLCPNVFNLPRHYWLRKGHFFSYFITFSFLFLLIPFRVFPSLISSLHLRSSLPILTPYSLNPNMHENWKNVASSTGRSEQTSGARTKIVYLCIYFIYLFNNKC